MNRVAGMTPRPSRILTAVPQWWPVRLEIAKAVRLLAAQVDDEREPQRRIELAAIRRDCEQVTEAIREFCQDVRKAGFNPDEPRVPAGNPDGGQWTRESGSGTSNESQVVSDATPDNIWRPGAQYAANDPPGLGHNQGPPLEEPPEIPRLKPSSLSAINDFLKAAAYWLAPISRFDKRALLFLAALQTTEWLVDKYLPSVISYLDPPKTWEELQQNQGPGYDEHHVVEQGSEKDGIPRSMIDSPDNVVPVPRLKHWQINSWLGRPNSEFKDAEDNDISPREYLKGKTWEQRYRFGLDVLIRFKVLKS
jgi:hypothetical protein